MADWTDLSDAAVGIGGIPSGTTVTALRDNAIAVAEGAGGAYTFLSEALVTTTVSSVDITLDTANYDDFKLIFTEVSQVNNFSLELLTSSDGGSTFASSSNNYANGAISTDTDNIKLTLQNFYGGLDNDVGGSGYFETIGAASTDQTIFMGASIDGDVSGYSDYVISGFRRSTSVVNAIRLKSAFGDLARIRYRLYGLKRSTVV